MGVKRKRFDGRQLRDDTKIPWTSTSELRDRAPVRKSDRLAPSQCAIRSSTHSMNTRQTTTRIVRNRVFNTTELFEEILLNLPMLDLLNLRRVNNHWQNVIHNSPRIQQKLFLQLSPDPGVWEFDRKTFDLHPYDEMAVNDHDRSREQEFQSTNGSEERGCHMRPSVLNPLLVQHESEENRGSLDHRAQFCESLGLVARPDLSKELGSSIYHYMFVTQPPVQSVEFTFQYNIAQRDKSGRVYTNLFIRRMVSDQDGVRFGHILKEFITVAPTMWHPWDSEYPDYPVTGYKIKIKPVGGYPKPKSTVWMLGAIFAREEEKMVVAKRDMRVRPSPLAKEMMSRLKMDVNTERSGSWWSKEDVMWAADDELRSRLVEGRERLP